MLRCESCGITQPDSAAVCQHCRGPLSALPRETPAPETNRRPLRGLRPPSLVKLVRTDPMSMAGTIVMAIGWFNYFAFTRFGFALSRRPARLSEDDGSFFLGFALVITPLMVALLAWRYFRFHALASHGRQVNAAVTGVTFYQAAARIDYSYTTRTGTFAGSKEVKRNSPAARHRPGDNLVVVVPPDRPDRAVPLLPGSPLAD